MVTESRLARAGRRKSAKPLPSASLAMVLRAAVPPQANDTRGTPSIVPDNARPTDATTAPAASGPTGSCSLAN